MAITYSAGAGTAITSPAMTETLATQAQQTGNNTVIVTDTLGNIGGGNIGDGSSGVGDTYAGRLLIIDQNSGTEQIRFCISDTAGTGTTRILTVSEDWVTNPVVTTDVIVVPYELADIEDGGAGGGVNLNSKSGLWEFGRILTMNSTGNLAALAGNAMELADRGTSLNMLVESGGFFYAGYLFAGAPISGIEMISFNGATGEPSVQVASGGHSIINDSLIWSQKVIMQHECIAGCNAIYRRTKFLRHTEELLLYDAELDDCSVGGTGTTTEIVRVNAGTVCNKLVLADVDTLDSVADTAAETIEMTAVQFVSVTDFINVRNNKTWDLIDPIWDATIYTDFTWVGSTANAVNDRRSVFAVVQEADGTKLQDALVNVYENTQLDDLVQELTTDVDGEASGNFLYLEHVTNSATTTYGGHAIQAGKWLYLPFVAAQVSSASFNGTIVLNPDSNIAETTQATAESAGSTITWNEDTNPSEVVAFTAGSGTLADGMIITYSPSGAVGTISTIMSGDSTAGEFHLHTRDATAIGTTQTFSRTGGTAGTFSGTHTDASEQPFSIWIDGQDLAMQVIYDYLAAIQNDTTLTADGEFIWEWCRSAQTQPLYHSGSSFFTEESNGKGIVIVDGGGGTQDYYTDDNGLQYIPPVTVNVTFDNLKDNSEVRIYEAGTNTELAGIEDATAGSVDNRNFAASLLAGTSVDYVIHNWQSGVTVYQSIRVNAFTWPSTDTTIQVQQQVDRNAV